LIIADIDGTQNEVEGLNIAYYPTIILFKKDVKDEPIIYNGDLRIDNLI
jgi:hypothetical protein